MNVLVQHHIAALSRFFRDMLGDVPFVVSSCMFLFAYGALGIMFLYSRRIDVRKGITGSFIGVVVANAAALMEHSLRSSNGWIFHDYPSLEPWTHLGFTMLVVGIIPLAIYLPIRTSRLAN